MPTTYRIGAEEAEEIARIRSNIKDKQVDKRLRAVQLRGEGQTNEAIGKVLETSSDMVSRWVCLYHQGGVKALLSKKREGHRRNMSYEAERMLLATFEERAQAGQVVEVSEIKRAYQEQVGHRIGEGQIYRVLKRHNWRKIKPRSRHPKKASPEAIDASKKLTHESEK